jgi:hypothetical protein
MAISPRLATRIFLKTGMVKDASLAERCAD